MVIPAVSMILLWHYIHKIQLTISIKQIPYCLKQVCYNSCQWCSLWSQGLILLSFLSVALHESGTRKALLGPW